MVSLTLTLRPLSREPTHAQYANIALHKQRVNITFVIKYAPRKGLQSMVGAPTWKYTDRIIKTVCACERASVI